MDQQNTKDYYHLTHLSIEGRVLNTFGAETINYLREKNRNGNVLDIDSSTGVTTKEMARIFPDSHVVGIEVDPKMFGEEGKMWRETYARRYLTKESPPQQNQPDFAVADGYNLPFASNSFETVFANNNLWHVVEDDKMTPERAKEIFRDIIRTIEPGGHLCISGNSIKTVSPYIIFEVDEQKNVKIVKKMLMIPF